MVSIAGAVGRSSHPLGRLLLFCVDVHNCTVFGAVPVIESMSMVTVRIIVPTEFSSSPITFAFPVEYEQHLEITLRQCAYWNCRTVLLPGPNRFCCTGCRTAHHNYEKKVRGA